MKKNINMRWLKEIMENDSLTTYDILEIANQKLNEAFSSLRELSIPDKVYEGMDIYGRRTITVEKNLQHSYEDVWGSKINSDRITVAKHMGYWTDCKGRALNMETEECLEHFSKQEFRFLSDQITDQDINDIITKFSDYFALDCDDINGSKINAIFISGFTSESPDSEWDDFINKLIDRAQKQRDRYTEQQIREKLGSVMDFEFVPWKSGVQEHIKDSKFKEGVLPEPDRLIVNQYLSSGRIEFPIAVVEDIERFLQDYKDWKENDADFEIGTKEYWIENNSVRVPKNFMGLVIGKGGNTIKEIAEIRNNGHRIKVIPTEVVESRRVGLKINRRKKPDIKNYVMVKK